MKQKVYSQVHLTLSNILSYIVSPYFLFFNLFRKKYYLKKIKVKKILILEYHRIGDVLIILPIIKSIRRGYPKSKIVLVCCEESYSLIDHFNVVDKIIPVKMPWTNWDFSLKEWFKVFQLIKKIRLEKTDLAFDFKGDLRNNWFLWNLKAKVSMGFSPTGGSYFLTNSFKFNHALHQRKRAQFIALKAGCDVLEKIKKGFDSKSKSVSVADLIILGGNVGIEKAIKSRTYISEINQRYNKMSDRKRKNFFRKAS